MKRLAVALLLVAAVGMVAGGYFVSRVYRRGKQIRTYTDMQAITAKIAYSLGAKPGEVNDLAGVIASVHGGRDRWGNNYVFMLLGEKPRTHQLLVSLGSDGMLDVADAAVYFGAVPSDIRGDLTRDIVFVDGRPLTIAGK